MYAIFQFYNKLKNKWFNAHVNYIFTNIICDMVAYDMSYFLNSNLIFSR